MFCVWQGHMQNTIIPLQDTNMEEKDMSWTKLTSSDDGYPLLVKLPLNVSLALPASDVPNPALASGCDLYQFKGYN